MRNRRIDRDHQIKRGHGTCGFHKIAEGGRKIVDRILAALECLEIGSTRANLQTRERGCAQIKERRERLQINRAAVIVGVFGVASPHHADFDAGHLVEPLFPALRKLARHAQIRHVRRDGFEPALEGARQAEQHGIAFIRFDIAAVAQDRDVGKA